MILVEQEDGRWRLYSRVDVFDSEGEALDALVHLLPNDAPSPAIVDVVAMPDRVATPTRHDF